MAEPVISHVNSVHQGMVDKIEPWYLPDTCAAYLQNLDIWRPGSRKRRLGAEDIGGRSDQTGGLWWAPDNVLEQDTLFGIWGGQVYVAPASGDLRERASSVSLTNALHAGISGRWGTRPASYVSQMQVHDSNASLASFLVAIDDNGTYSQSAFMAPRVATWFQNRLWAVPAVDPEALWWSEILDGLSWSLTNSMYVEPGTGGPITGLCAVRGDQPQLVIFKKRALCVLRPRWGSSSAYIPQAADALDTLTSELKLLSGNVGCVGARTIQYIPGYDIGEVIFLSFEGFRSVRVSEQNDLEGASLPISDQISSTIARINFAHAHKAVSAVVGPFYYCAVPLDGATQNTHVVAFDLINKSWSVHTWAARDLVGAMLLETKDYLWMQYAETTTDCSVTGGFAGYHAFKCFSGYLDPDGAPVQFQEDTKGFVPTGNIMEKMRWDWVGLSVKNEAGATCTLTVLYNIDQSGWVTAGSLCFEAVASLIYLGSTPLPWEPNTTEITTKYLSLADAPPGFEIQIRYVSEDEFAIPSVLDVAVKSTPIGHEIDNHLT